MCTQMLPKYPIELKPYGCFHIFAFFKIYFLYFFFIYFLNLASSYWQDLAKGTAKCAKLSLGTGKNDAGHAP